MRERTRWINMQFKVIQTRINVNYDLIIISMKKCSIVEELLDLKCSVWLCKG